MSRKKKSIKEKVNELPIVADLKFRRFFSQGTPETFYIIEKFLELAISDNIKVTNITCQKHVFDSDQNENVTDLCNSRLNGMPFPIETECCFLV